MDEPNWNQYRVITHIDGPGKRMDKVLEFMESFINWRMGGDVVAVEVPTPEPHKSETIVMDHSAGTLRGREEATAARLLADAEVRRAALRPTPPPAAPEEPETTVVQDLAEALAVASPGAPSPKRVKTKTKQRPKRSR